MQQLNILDDESMEMGGYIIIVIQKIIQSQDIVILMKYLLAILLLGILASAYSPQPIPSCTSPSFTLKDVPISLKETQTFSLNSLFTGFNLRFTNSTTTPNFVTINDKLNKIKSLDTNLTGIFNYNFPAERNDFGTQMTITLTNGNTTTVRWGRMPPGDYVPTLGDPVVVESKGETVCFDAAWRNDVIIVDCANKIGSVIQNVFLYVNTTTKAAMNVSVLNDMYVSFKRMQSRKIYLHQQDGYTYLIRAYMAQFVDEANIHNTYLEFMSINNILRPFTIKIMDRSFLMQDKLSITDFKVYLGDMYILDYHSGVSRFDITTSQNIIITGRYRTDAGYVKMGVYSNNFDNEFYLVLANEHAIYEIDWTNQIAPRIIAKYSLMDNSRVHQVHVTEEYVYLQSTANATNTQNQTVTYQATTIFNRNTRTYLNAYAMVPHTSRRVFIGVERNRSLFMTVDEQGISTFHISDPIVNIFPVDPKTQWQQFKFSIIANSTNPYNGHSLICTLDFVTTVVDIHSRALWPTGIPFSENYYANYPGQLFIRLSSYVWGSNVTWYVHENKSPNSTAELPTYWILQQNSTILHWDKEPSIGKITFLRQQQYDSLDETDLYIYTQDAFNKTHIVKCTTVPYNVDVFCSDTGYVPYVNKGIANLTANRFHYYEGKYLHLAAVLFNQQPNSVYIYDVEGRRPFILNPLVMGEGYQGRISSIEFLGHYLIVVLKYIKEIVVYDMIQCYDSNPDDPICKEVIRIDSVMMDRIGVGYFSPVHVYASDFHPFVLFIQCIDRVVVVDFTRRGPIKLGEVMSPGSQQPGYFKFKIAITRQSLVIVNPPNILEEHSLRDMFSKRDIPLQRVYPIYNYTIPDVFDLDFSDIGDLLYITAIDTQLPKEMNSVILVYKAQVPSVAALYDVFHLYGSYSDILIDATGVFGDYISVSMGTILTIFRQYADPILVFEDTFDDFTFDIGYTNDPQDSQPHILAKSNVFIANFPQKIKVNNQEIAQEGFFTNKIQYRRHQTKEYKFWDHKWFNGSVINYTLFNCDECGKKFKVINHLEDRRHVVGSVDMNDYVFTIYGGIIQQSQSVMTMRHNGSLHEYVSLPSVLDGQNCQYVAHSWMYQYSVSACRNNLEVYLYVTTYTASKPFTQGPFYSSAQSVTNIQLMQDMLMVVDVDENPSRLSREGGILLYGINHDPFDPEVFDELQFIDTDDLVVANGWPGGPAFIGNAHLVWTNSTSLYRLFITELRYGLFVVDYRWNKQRQSVEISKVTFLNIHDILAKVNLVMPNMAFFEAVTVLNQYYDRTFKYWQIDVILTTRNFHNFQFNMHVADSGTVVTCQLAQIFYRYGFYETTNYIKAFDGYFAIVQKVPFNYQSFPWYSKQVLSIYDTRPRRTNDTNQTPNKYQGTDINATWMLGGMVYPVGRISFDFNFTFTRNETDPFRDLGLLVLHSRQLAIRQININDEISIITEEGMADQDAYLRMMNDFSKVEISVKVIGINEDEGLPGWGIALIVIGCVAVAAVGGFFAWRIFIRRRMKSDTEIKESLLTQQGKNQKSDSESSGQKQDVSDEEEEEEEEEEESDEEEPTKQEKKQPAVVVDTSINRNTVSSVDQEEHKEEEEKKEQEVKQEANVEANKQEQS